MGRERSEAGKEEYTVFVSHASTDSYIARSLKEKIEEKGQEHGVRALLDEKDVEYGGSIPDWVRDGIRGCGEFVVLLSEASKDRSWVLIEIGAAWVLKKRIVAVIDKISPDEMPDVITPFRAVDLNDFEDYRDQLVDRVKEAKRA